MSNRIKNFEDFDMDSKNNNS